MNSSMKRLLKLTGILFTVMGILLISAWIYDESNKGLDCSRLNVECEDQYRPKGAPQYWSEPHPSRGDTIMQWSHLKDYYYSSDNCSSSEWYTNPCDWNTLRWDSHVDQYGKEVADVVYITQCSNGVELEFTAEGGGFRCDPDADGYGHFKILKSWSLELPAPPDSLD
jgi:hypothetical protein